MSDNIGTRTLELSEEEDEEEEGVSSSVDAPTVTVQGSDDTASTSKQVTHAVDGRDATDAIDSSTDIEVNNICSFPSSSSSCCRICQLGDEGSNESLTTSRCLCRGHLAKVHHSCLAEWVRYRGSNRCEICNQTFLDMPAPQVQSVNLNRLREQIGEIQLPPQQQEFLYYQALEILRTELPQYRISRRKRTAITGSIMFLFLITGVAAMLTLGASRDFQKISSNPWASIEDVRKNHVVLAISLSFSFFCGTLTVGLALMWLVVECFYYIKRRQILQRVTERFILQRRNSRNTRTPEGVI